MVFFLLYTLVFIVLLTSNLRLPMFKYFHIFILSIVFQLNLTAQESIDSIQKIEEVLIESQRIEIPFSKTSHSISIVTSDELTKSTATTIAEVLQLVIGVDIRTKGIEGMQADLYIRGGNFNQTLLLIDGIKMDDSQTGHHTLNGLINIDNIKRIELIKGAAARIYGQNAMNGAINIITKNYVQNQTELKLNLGSFQNYGVGFQTQQKIGEGDLQLQIQKQVAEGYRYNTDFDNLNIFLKGKWKNYSLITSFGKRDFGANGFYASPKFIDQYEETQTNLVAVKGNFSKLKWKLKPTVYWRQNQDLFLLVRNDPSIYRNKHITNKLGVSLNATSYSEIGTTGLGLDIYDASLKSNNLGNRQRLVTNLFAEHRFQYLDNKLDFTPGIAIAHYSDFGFFTYPGLNIGFEISNHIKLYADMGYTSRIPTFTNLYYNSRTELGNPNLKPEKALTKEVGLHANFNKININMAYFERASKDLIDWVKSEEIDLWQAKNIAEVQTKGIEFESSYKFLLNSFPQRINIGYTFIDDQIKNNEYLFSRYSLNSYKHQFVSSFTTQLFSFLSETISYRYSERTDGQNYHLLDAALNTEINKWEIKLKANNIFNTSYSETNLVPMPGFNFMTEVSYTF